MMEPDGNRISRLLVIVSGLFLGIYLATALHKLYRLQVAPETVSAEAISPFVDIAIIGLVILSWLIYKLISNYRSSDERDFIRTYKARQKNSSSIDK